VIFGGESMPGAGMTTRPLCGRGHRGGVADRTACLRERGQPTSGSAAPGGLPPVRARQAAAPEQASPLPPARLLAVPFVPARDLPVTSASSTSDAAGPGPAWHAAGVPLKPWRKLSQPKRAMRVRLRLMVDTLASSDA
jgi:hypothetical protein